MRKYSFLSRIFIPFLLISTMLGCEEQKTDDIYKQLEDKAKITTFPLTIVITDRLAGDEFPQDLKLLCSLSDGSCKTLPVSGILRLGPDQYYTYNSISALKVGSADGDDEKSVAAGIKQQVASYLVKTSLKDYDSLKSPNHSDYNIPLLSADYIRTTEDSIFFYSASPTAPPFISVGDRSYRMYKDAAELRRTVDEMICKKQATVSIFYSPGPVANAVPGALLPSGNEGIYAGDTCIGTTRFEKRNDGKGNYFVGKMVEENSRSCGFRFPTGVAGDTCIGKAKYQRLHNGRGGFKLGELIERNSTACGFTFPTGIAGDTCVSGSKYQKMHNGRGGFVLGNLIEKNSRACGFTFPTGVAGDTCVSGSKYQKLHNGRGGFRIGSLLEKNSRSCGFTYPAKNSVAAGYMCYQGSKYEKLNDGAGGFLRGKLVQANSADCSATKPPAPAITTKPETKVPVTRPTTEPKAPVTTARPETKAPVTRPKTEPKAPVTTVRPETKTPVETLPGTDRRCARTSEPICEQDAQGNYTGRRVQYCYNNSGKVVRTIVVSRCDSDCRCLGK